MSVSQILRERRSCRQYVKGFEIPKEHLQEIMDAAIVSPTAMNFQGLDLKVCRYSDKVVEASRALMESWGSCGMYDNMNSRRESLGVVDPITCDANALFFLVKNERCKPDYMNIDAGIMSMAIMATAKSLGYETLPIGLILMGDASKYEELLHVGKGDIVMLVAVGKAAPEFTPGEKEILAKAELIE